MEFFRELGSAQRESSDPSSVYTWLELFFSERNNATYPVFHQLNLSATYFGQTKRGRNKEWSFGLYNAYGRNNPWTMDYNLRFYKEEVNSKVQRL